MITIVAALSANGVIGTDGKLPWYNKEELQHFKQLTTGKTIIMGRKTFESIGKPLPNRRNIVISKTLKNIEGAEIYENIDEALAKAGNKEVFVIGGREIFEQTIELANKMYLSYIDGNFEGEVLFPTFNEKQWKIIEKKKYSGFETIVYARRKK